MLRRANNRRMLAMRRTERIVHVQVLPVDECAYERRIIGCLPCVKSQVLKQGDTGEQLVEAIPHRGNRILRIRLPFGTAKVAHQDQLSTAIDHALDAG